jgi:two-component system, cell cycle sensor histidine kinase and response regulator CckA
MPLCPLIVDHPGVTGLRYRLEPHARVLLDLGLGAFLALLWATGEVTLWLHLAYISIALGAFLRPRARSTVVRVGVVTVIGGASLLRLRAQGMLPAGDLLEIPLLSVLALLFAGFAYRRSLVEEEVTRDKMRLARQVDRIPLATVAFDEKARVVTWNARAAELFGWTADEAIGELNPIIPAGERAQSDELFARIRKGKRLNGIEVTRHARDGTVLELCLYSAPLSKNMAVVLYDDIGERKRAERERDHAESRYRSLIESLPIVTYINLAEGIADNVYISPQIVEMLGWPSADWEADSHFFATLLHPDDRQRVMEEVVEASETHAQFDSEYRLRHAEGHYVWVHDRSGIVDEGTDAFARGFLVDITEKKKLEEQLQQAQKLEALGQLAGGIAHDFNNLLTGIGGYAELAASETEPGTVASRSLDGIKTAAAEATSLTSRLLAFSRRNVPDRRVVDVNAIVSEAASLLERLVPASVRVQLSLGHLLPTVVADLEQLKQVALNLALNARDAMPDGGTLTIETAASGDSVLLRVRDTGLGMDAATRSRALEPFFTTKPEGEGTGLGLSVVYGVVDGLGGRLSIESAVGLGTIVEISLPAAGAAPHPAAPEEAPIAAQNAERVLIVEDRDVVRDLTRDVLESSGFDVVAVAGGREALETVAAAEPFELLLTDVVMPEMSGPELAVKLRARYPALPVLYMSGYTDDVLSAHELEQEGTAFLRKPFSNAELIAAVRVLLDGQPWASAALAKANSSALPSRTPAAG